MKDRFTSLNHIRFFFILVAVYFFNPLLHAQTPRTYVRTLDDQFAEVAQVVPAFGGIYMDSDKTLRIVLTESNPATIAKVKTELIRVFGANRIPQKGIQIVQGQYGFLALKGMHDRARNIFQIHGVNLLDIDERKNRLKIGLIDMNAQKEVEKQLKKFNVPLQAVVFQQTKPLKNFTNLTDKVRPLVGGLQITPGCTLGFIATRSGVHGLVTCSHCTQTMAAVDGGTFKQPDGGDQVGVETVDPSAFTGGSCPSGSKCRFSDAAFIKLDSGVTAQRGEIAHYTDPWHPGNFEIEGTVDFPFCGESVTKVGVTTEGSFGEISDTCEDTESVDGITKLCQDIADAKSGPGDSGSPVFIYTDTNWPYTQKLCGILWGGEADVAVSDIFAFSPFGLIEAELGSLKVNQFDESPTVQILQPANNAKVSYSGFSEVTFQAKADDFESGSDCCDISWTSDKDGGMGTGETLQYHFVTSGKRTITATANQGHGADVNTSKSAKASITIDTTNEPPVVTIDFPLAGATIYKQIPYIFDGSASDKQQIEGIPCSSLKWSSDNSADLAFPKAGCNPNLSFNTTGSRKVTLTATDSENKSGSGSVTVNVTDAPKNTGPIITILNPRPDWLLEPNDSIELRATAKDPDNKSPLSYKWVLSEKNTTLKTGTMNDGSTVSYQWKPGDNVSFHCGGKTIQLYFYATDPDGSTSSGVVEVRINFPVC